MKLPLRTFTLAGVLAASFTSLTSQAATEPSVSNAADGWNFNLTATDYTTLCTKTLDQARQAFAAIENTTGPATVDGVFGAYDAMTIALGSIEQSWYMKSVHPAADVRDAAEACVQEYTDFTDSQSLSRKFFDRVAAIDTSAASPTERLMVEKRMRDFRQSGVDRDQATRDQVRALKREITETGNLFDKTIREDTRYVETTLEQLAGLPQDYLDSHPANDAGVIRISTDYPDYYPVMKYGSNDALRRQLYIARTNIASPANNNHLKALLDQRHQLATLLGYSNYAALAMDGMMIESPSNAQAFLADVGSALKQPAQRDLGLLLKRLQKIDPGAEQVQVWQASYLSNLVRQEDYALDSKLVREYFQFDKVQAGIFQLTEDLFDVSIIPWQTSTWQKDVTAWEVRDKGKVLGRFYLDMHPRENKYKHAAHWTLRTGLRNGQVPISGLATNFPRGLMEHGQVETFLHEFGHLLHNMFSGTQAWTDVTGMSMERDFVEAPSQMLEEWVWDYDTLRLFASNAQGETIPKSLVEKMNNARNFGTALNTANQIFYANLSLNYYSRDPAKFELLALLKTLQAQYSPYPYLEGTYFYNNFGHLNGYSSNYYIYQWSLAIATDLFSSFEAAGLRDKAVAGAYRRKVLGAAGSKPAADFVADFLGRPFSTKAYIDFLNSLN